MKFLKRFIVPNPQLTPEHEALFHEETLSSARNSLQFVCFAAGTLYPIFGVLDYISFPDRYLGLVFIRCIVVPFVFLTLGLTFVDRLRPYQNWFGIGLFQVLALGIIAMTWFTGGKTSPYYAGIILVLLTQIVAMPWRLRMVFANSFGVWGIYTISVILLDWINEANSSEADWRLFIGNNFFLIGTILIGSVWSGISFRLRKVVFLNRAQLALEKEKSEELLRNTLPDFVIEELKRNGSVHPRRLDCTVLFTDSAGFTKISEKMEPEDVLLELDRSFEYFDTICEKFGMDKIKTIGDSYMCAAGVDAAGKRHAIVAALTAIEFRSYMNMMKQIKMAVNEEYWQIRIGIHSGPVVGGIVGKFRYAYDIWGDTVNTASRMESSGIIGEINISQDTNSLLQEYFVTHSRGLVNAKGKGELEMFTLDSIRPEFADDEAGRTPNAKLLSLIDIS